jgi:hypothetical protein
MAAKIVEHIDIPKLLKNKIGAWDRQRRSNTGSCSLPAHFVFQPRFLSYPWHCFSG